MLDKKLYQIYSIKSVHSHKLEKFDNPTVDVHYFTKSLLLGVKELTRDEKVEKQVFWFGYNLSEMQICQIKYFANKVYIMIKKG